MPFWVVVPESGSSEVAFFPARNAEGEEAISAELVFEAAESSSCAGSEELDIRGDLSMLPHPLSNAKLTTASTANKLFSVVFSNHLNMECLLSQWLMERFFILRSAFSFYIKLKANSVP